MAMVESHSLADVDGFHTNRWGIPEPPSLEGRIDGNILLTLIVALKQKVPLDLIIVPGVGFDRSMNRIGHGKGYYDRFIQCCYDQARQIGQEPPTLSTTSQVRLIDSRIGVESSAVGQWKDSDDRR
jgi:5-formyltetrahydrofolate cyclo-ligase